MQAKRSGGLLDSDRGDARPAPNSGSDSSQGSASATPAPRKKVTPRLRLILSSFDRSSSTCLFGCSVAAG